MLQNEYLASKCILAWIQPRAGSDKFCCRLSARSRALLQTFCVRPRGKDRAESEVAMAHKARNQPDDGVLALAP